MFTHGIAGPGTILRIAVVGILDAVPAPGKELQCYAMPYSLIIINVGIESRVPVCIGILGIIQGRLADGQPVRHSEGIHEILAGTIGIPASILPQRIDPAVGRSEERRVGKECRSRWSPYH